jgi:CBS domain-containing protein
LKGSFQHSHLQCISPDATLINAARRMKKLNVSSLTVCERGELIGTVSNADVTFRAVARCLNHNTATVRQVMTADAVYCFDDQNVDEAGRIMNERQVPRLPVVNHQKRFLGIISVADLALCARKNKLTREVLAFRRAWSCARDGMFRATVPA